jgi:hypothetical protein
VCRLGWWFFVRCSFLTMSQLRVLVTSMECFLHSWQRHDAIAPPPQVSASALCHVGDTLGFPWVHADPLPTTTICPKSLPSTPFLPKCVRVPAPCAVTWSLRAPLPPLPGHVLLQFGTLTVKLLAADLLPIVGLLEREPFTRPTAALPSSGPDSGMSSPTSDREQSHGHGVGVGSGVGTSGGGGGLPDPRGAPGAGGVGPGGVAGPAPGAPVPGHGLVHGPSLGPGNSGIQVGWHCSAFPSYCCHCPFREYVGVARGCCCSRLGFKLVAACFLLLQGGIGVTASRVVTSPVVQHKCTGIFVVLHHGGQYFRSSVVATKQRNTYLGQFFPFSYQHTEFTAANVVPAFGGRACVPLCVHCAQKRPVRSESLIVAPVTTLLPRLPAAMSVPGSAVGPGSSEGNLPGVPQGPISSTSRGGPMADPSLESAREAFAGVRASSVLPPASQGTQLGTLWPMHESPRRLPYPPPTPLPSVSSATSNVGTCRLLHV